jgi:hypothetical protein
MLSSPVTHVAEAGFQRKRPTRAILLHRFFGAWSVHTTPPQGQEQSSSRTQHAQVIENVGVVLSLNSREFARAFPFLACGIQHVWILSGGDQSRSLVAASDPSLEASLRGQIREKSTLDEARNWVFSAEYCFCIDVA